MGLANWLGTLFSHRRITDSQINILTESQPLTNLSSDCKVVLQSAQPTTVEETSSVLDNLEAEFSDLVACVGGKERLLFVGDPETAGKTSGGGIFHELSHGLFGQADGDRQGGLVPDQEKCNPAGKGHAKTVGIVHPAPPKSRAFKYPAILVVFKLSAVKEKTNKVMIREILKDVRARSKEATQAVIGIVYCEEQAEEEEEQASSHRLTLYLKETFHPEDGSGQVPRVSVCLYIKSRPESILGVRSCVWEALRDTVQGSPSNPAESKNWREPAGDVDPQKSFWDLVTQVGGKESFLFVGMLCPSVEMADKVRLFQEVAQDLFNDKRSLPEGDTCRHNRIDDTPSRKPKGTTSEGALKPCTQLQTPQIFSYPIILAVFNLQFVKEKTNKVLIREILKDVCGRSKEVTPGIVGIVYSKEQTSEEEKQTSLSRLSRYLQETFQRNAGGSCTQPASVCFYVKSRPQSILGVKRCICGVLRHRDTA